MILVIERSKVDVDWVRDYIFIEGMITEMAAYYGEWKRNTFDDPN